MAIIGGGACALMLACELDPEKFDVCIYEKNVALGRKFLVAGDGGFNLTNAEDPIAFVQRYTPVDFIERAFLGFNNQQCISWLNGMGLATFVGSSGRIFPKKGLKPIDVLQVFLEKIKTNRCVVKTKTEWMGFGSGQDVLFKTENQEDLISIKPDYVVFCLGGASWPVTGSKGDWGQFFLEKNIGVNSFEASNCAFGIHWPETIVSQIQGKALKNCTISCGGKSLAGEIVITAFGIEGSGIYPLSPQIRQQLKALGQAEVFVDLKPRLSLEHIINTIKKSRTNKSFTKYLSEALNINLVQMALLKNLVSKEDFLDPAKLATHIKNLKLMVYASGPIVDAISTVGGVALNEVDQNFELYKLQKHFVIGEMLDYDAPTGGYLLQSCFTMAKHLADHLNEI